MFYLLAMHISVFLTDDHYILFSKDKRNTDAEVKAIAKRTL